jgi:hypothetical protein
MLLGQLALALATAIVYFGDPRFRVPFDVFGLALAGSLIADRIAPPGQTTAADSRVQADQPVEQPTAAESEMAVGANDEDVLPVGTHALDAWVRREDRDGSRGHVDETANEEDLTYVEKR